MMGFIKKLFGFSEEITTDNLNEKLDLGQHFYLMDYKDSYSEFLEGLKNKNKIIAELFVFRAWTTQFGFRIFSSKPQVSEEIIGQVFQQGKMLGIGILEETQGINLEKELNGKYVDIVDEKWQEYDALFIKNKNSEPQIPTRQICGQLTENCDIQDPTKFTWLCTNFLEHLDNIKKEALDSGLLSE
jgi:hypothetical protein